MWVMPASPPDPGEQVGGVDFLGPLDAVGGHDDGPGKLAEFLGLVLQAVP